MSDPKSRLSGKVEAVVWLPSISANGNEIRIKILVRKLYAKLETALRLNLLETHVQTLRICSATDGESAVTATILSEHMLPQQEGSSKPIIHDANQLDIEHRHGQFTVDSIEEFASKDGATRVLILVCPKGDLFFMGPCMNMFALGDDYDEEVVIYYTQAEGCEHLSWNG